MYVLLICFVQVWVGAKVTIVYVNLPPRSSIVLRNMIGRIETSSRSEEQYKNTCEQIHPSIQRCGEWRSYGKEIHHLFFHSTLTYVIHIRCEDTHAYLCSTQNKGHRYVCTRCMRCIIIARPIYMRTQCPFVRTPAMMPFPHCDYKIFDVWKNDHNKWWCNARLSQRIDPSVQVQLENPALHGCQTPNS